MRLPEKNRAHKDGVFVYGFIFVGAISMALNSLTSDFAEHGDHLAHDLSMRAIDRGVGGIVRNEPDMAMILAERFHRGFIVEQHSDPPL